MIGDTLAQYNHKKNNDKTEYITIDTYREINTRKLLPDQRQGGHQVPDRPGQHAQHSAPCGKSNRQAQDPHPTVQRVQQVHHDLQPGSPWPRRQRAQKTTWRILRVYYPLHISNKNLYNVCGSYEITKNITKQRWRLFGHHILRSNINTLANIAMTHYFETHSRTTGEKRKKHKGAEATSIAVVRAAPRPQASSTHSPT
jgi:hypothetical protein